MTAKTRFGLLKFRECSVSLYLKMFPLRLLEAVYKSYLRSCILYACEV